MPDSRDFGLPAADEAKPNSQIVVLIIGIEAASLEYNAVAAGNK